MHKESTVRRYFQAWIDKDSSVLADVFSDEAVYTESYGPQYHGLKQISQWFADWNKRGTVLEWTIKQFISQGETVAAEWFFRCEYDSVTSGFDGVSVIEFDDEGKIVNLREFQSKAEHCFPYGDVSR
ncbi:MAG: nuclear transport factor 2 family protein [Ruminococcaceae bacterium]|nr:nuclear transport factor 2 family protein [Oscillospiraceae bacterium]